MRIYVFSYEEPCFNVEMLMLNAVIASRCDPACVGVDLDSVEHFGSKFTMIQSNDFVCFQNDLTFFVISFL